MHLSTIISTSIIVKQEFNYPNIKSVLSLFKVASLRWWNRRSADISSRWPLQNRWANLCITNICLWWLITQSICFWMRSSYWKLGCAFRFFSGSWLASFFGILRFRRITSGSAEHTPELNNSRARLICSGILRNPESGRNPEGRTHHETWYSVPRVTNIP